MSDRAVLAAASRFVGVPYVPHGSTPDGWDCWGCTRYLRRELFGLQSPSWSEVYSAADARDLGRVEELVRERLDAWRPVDVRPGAALLFRVFNRDAHVGLMLTRLEFIHTLAGQETTIVRLDDSRWANRLRGAYDTAPEATARGD